MFIIMVFCVLINLFFAALNLSYFLQGDVVNGFVAFFNMCAAGYCSYAAGVIRK